MPIAARRREEHLRRSNPVCSPDWIASLHFATMASALACRRARDLHVEVMATRVRFRLLITAD